jgi:hypothetical protein
MLQCGNPTRQGGWPWAPVAPAPLAWPALPEVTAGLELFSATLSLPFDVLRVQHAEAVHAGLMANSMLESRDFEKTVDALEHATLGPFARQV